MTEDTLSRKSGFRNANRSDTGLVLRIFLMSEILNIVMWNISRSRQKESFFYHEGAAGSSEKLVPVYQTTRSTFQKTHRLHMNHREVRSHIV
jgi:hypothetical protein